MIKSFALLFILFFSIPINAATVEKYLDFNITKDGSGSNGVTLRHDGKIVNFKKNDWFCIATDEPIADNTKIHMKIKKKDDGKGNIEITHQDPDDTLLGYIDVSNNETFKSHYAWTSKTDLKTTSKKQLCFVNKAAMIEIDKISIITKSGEKKYDSGISNASGNSNLQVFIKNNWEPVCCEGKTLTISNKTCSWQETGRVLTEDSSKKLNCPENDGNEAACYCGLEGEKMHGAPDGHVSSSLKLPGGAPIFPNIGRETCVKVMPDGSLKAKFSSVKGNKWDNQTGWPDKSCPHFRLLNNY
jgi:hypothetical protein